MWFWPKIAQKRQKNRSCRFWRYQMWISQKSPNLDNLTSVFGVFKQFLAKLHLVARQNVTFGRFDKNMSVWISTRVFAFGISCRKKLKPIEFYKKQLWANSLVYIYYIYGSVVVGYWTGTTLFNVCCQMTNSLDCNWSASLLFFYYIFTIIANDFIML